MNTIEYLKLKFTHLVIFRGRYEEEDGGDGIETLKPPPPLRPLPTDVHHLKGNVLDLKVILVDPLGGLTGQQDVLLTGKIILPEKQSQSNRMQFKKPTLTWSLIKTHQQKGFTDRRLFARKSVIF